ncbi:hypothetical protein TcG_09408 [Trypanosoma cruzi]|nr:hypothetical protein TcG_09408 [Trypanosoma cruzi]
MFGLRCLFCRLPVSSARAVRTKMASIQLHTGRRAGWSSPKRSQSIFSMTRAFTQWMRRSLPWSVGDQQPVASVMKRWRKSLVHLECPRLCFLRALPYWHAWIFGGDQRTRCLLRKP